MTRIPSPLERRVAAAQATLDRFKDRPFRWGMFDCARMTAWHLRQLGYGVKMPPAGQYRSIKSAKAELAKVGFADLPDALDAMGMERIAPAAGLPGDVLQWPSENEIAALGIFLGNGRMIAYHPDAKGACVLQPLEFIAAWRADPK